MGLLTINLPATGPYARTSAFVSTPYHKHPPRPNIVYYVRVADVEVDLVSREYAKQRLLTHAQMYRHQLVNAPRWNFVVTDRSIINALPAHWFSMTVDNSEDIAEVDSFIAILQNPETRFLKSEHVSKPDSPFY